MPDYLPALIASSIMIGLLLIVLFWIMRVLRRASKWSFAEALSENGLASCSRLIAFLGFIVIVDVLFGFGLFAVWSLFTKGSLPSMTGALAFASGGATLFTPYFANQIKTGLATVVTAPPPPQITSTNPPSVNNGVVLQKLL